MEREDDDAYHDARAAGAWRIFFESITRLNEEGRIRPLYAHYDEVVNQILKAEIRFCQIDEKKAKLMSYCRFPHHMDTCHPQYPAHKRIRSRATEFDTNLLIVTVHGDDDAT